MNDMYLFHIRIYYNVKGIFILLISFFHIIPQAFFIIISNEALKAKDIYIIPFM
jgi:hypothetical protein